MKNGAGFPRRFSCFALWFTPLSTECLTAVWNEKTMWLCSTTKKAAWKPCRFLRG